MRRAALVLMQLPVQRCCCRRRRRPAPANMCVNRDKSCTVDTDRRMTSRPMGGAPRSFFHRGDLSEKIGIGRGIAQSSRATAGDTRSSPERERLEPSIRALERMCVLESVRHESTVVKKKLNNTTLGRY